MWAGRKRPGGASSKARSHSCKWNLGVGRRVRRLQPQQLDQGGDVPEVLVGHAGLLGHGREGLDRALVADRERSRDRDEGPAALVEWSLVEDRAEVGLVALVDRRR